MGQTDAAGLKFTMNSDREDFLSGLGVDLNWVDRRNVGVDPYTAAYCARAGWIMKRTNDGVRQYRITDAGLEALAPAMWR